MTKVASKTTCMAGRFQMDATLFRAGRATHLKIVLVSLVAAAIVVVIGINARTSNVETARGTTGLTIVKATPAKTFADQESATIR